MLWPAQTAHLLCCPRMKETRKKPPLPSRRFYTFGRVWRGKAYAEHPFGPSPVPPSPRVGRGLGGEALLAGTSPPFPLSARRRGGRGRGWSGTPVAACRGCVVPRRTISRAEMWAKLRLPPSVALGCCSDGGPQDQPEGRGQRKPGHRPPPLKPFLQRSREFFKNLLDFSGGGV